MILWVILGIIAVIIWFVVLCLQVKKGEEILIQQWIEKWDGKVPEYDSTDLIFNTGNLGATEAAE